MPTFHYDRAYDPPAPVVPIRVTAPGTERAALLPGLVDTGADCTVIPERVARDLGLPRIDRIEITGVTGSPRRVAVHAAHLQLMGIEIFFRVVALEGETILGRDLLSRVRIELDGPHGLVHLRGQRARSR
jgi:predicted aspartyl protease